jgi:hypothetical protein
VAVAVVVAVAVGVAVADAVPLAVGVAVAVGVALGQPPPPLVTLTSTDVIVPKPSYPPTATAVFPTSVPDVNERTIEGGTKMLTFHGVTIMWNPEFSDLDALYAPATAWEKRCYFINGRHIKLRPIDGQDMVTRKPPRAYDKYEYYWGLTWRGAISRNRSNAQAVLAVA